jgi:hypothetical protein
MEQSSDRRAILSRVAGPGWCAQFAPEAICVWTAGVPPLRMTFRASVPTSRKTGSAVGNTAEQAPGHGYVNLPGFVFTVALKPMVSRIQVLVEPR